MAPTQWRFTAFASIVLAGLLFSSWNGAAQTRGGAPPRPTTGSGPLKAVMEMDAGLPDHTIYRPEDMSALNGATLPLVIWGNGACANAGNSFSNFLTDISSHGFLAIALGRQNRRHGPICGGVQAIEVAADSRVTTAVIWNSGLFPQPTNMGGGKTLSKKDLYSIHVPMAYISGDSTDIAYNNANADFEYLKLILCFALGKEASATAAHIASRMAANSPVSPWRG